MINISFIRKVQSNCFIDSGTLTAWPMMMTLKTSMRRFLHTGKDADGYDDGINHDDYNDNGAFQKKK